MPIFRDTDHLYQVLGALFDRLSTEPQVANRLLESKLIVRFRYKDPEGIVTVDMRSAPISYRFGESDLEPDVEMIQSGDTSAPSSTCVARPRRTGMVFRQGAGAFAGCKTRLSPVC